VCCGFTATTVTEPMGEQLAAPSHTASSRSTKQINPVQSGAMTRLVVIAKVIARKRPETAEIRTFLGTRSQSGRRDLNPQHSAWKADTLPLSYVRILTTPLYAVPCVRGVVVAG
jgi:hypothetical protein